MRMLVLMFGLSWMMQNLGCAPSEPNNLDALGTVDLTIHDRSFRLWVADSVDEQTRGLMYITAEEMAPLPDGTERGMLFKFNRARQLSFWMKNTIIPLDIAYLDPDGKVVAMYTMAPLDTSLNNYPSLQPAMFAIEVNADVFSDVGLQVGDVVDIP